ncbi:amidohydrolase [Candidatus Parvarchaeota archaeon]|nr:amidohydrolase [Candidatus Parvarchaeota archaeon]
MDILIKNASVPGTGGRTEKKDVLIREGLISRVASSGSLVGGTGCEKLDATGKILLRGFANCHTHAAMSLLRGISDELRTEQWLAEKIWPAEKKLDSAAIYAGSMLACIEMIKNGTTVFNDMYFGMDAVMDAAKDSGMRAVLGYGMIDLNDEKKRKSELGVAQDLIKKAQGATGGLIKASVAPHSVYTCSEELLVAAKELAEKYGVRLHIHLSETRKEVFECLEKTWKNKKFAKGLRPAEYLDMIGFLGKNVIAAHCCWLTLREIKLLGKSGASACLNPVSNMKLASGGVPAVPEMKQAGLNVCLGTDGAASNNSLSMFESMKFLALLVNNSRWDPTLVRAGDALLYATEGGYRALGLDSGRLESGGLADLITIDAKAANMSPQSSIVSNIVYAGHAGNVCDSIIGGRLVMENGKLLAVDEEKEIENAQKELERLGLLQQ